MKINLCLIFLSCQVLVPILKDADSGSEESLSKAIKASPVNKKTIQESVREACNLKQRELSVSYRLTGTVRTRLWLLFDLPAGQKLKFYLQELHFTSHRLNLQHWTGFYIAVYGNFQGLFFIFEGSFLHFGGKIARSPCVIFPCLSVLQCKSESGKGNPV